MLLFKELMWFFKQEKKSYGIGILVLICVAIINLFPPYVVRVIVDGASKGNLTQGSLLKWSLLLLAAGLTAYSLRYIWRLLIFGASSRLGRLLRKQLFEHFIRLSRQFYQQHRTGDLMAHATNDIQAIEMTAGMGVLTLVDSLTTGSLVVFSMAFFISWKLTLITLLPMLAFGWLFNILERGRASYGRVNLLLNVKDEIYDQEGAVDRVPSGQVTYEMASFSYPGTQSLVLEKIDVVVNQGQTLGIVGRTGSGKTTFFRLLLREFDLCGGDIKIGELSIYDLRLESLRQGIGYVPQDHFLFSTTIAENIAFGKPEATLEEIQAAADIAAIHKDILHFQDKYGTLVGDRGVTLSGGQKQRISIARALLLQPEILLLDDSLSAVDAKTEKAILQGLKEKRSQKTTLISSHRLSAIEHADLIIVIESGKITEQGSHAELMAVEGWYASTYRSQQLESLIEEGGA